MKAPFEIHGDQSSNTMNTCHICKNVMKSKPYNLLTLFNYHMKVWTKACFNDIHLIQPLIDILKIWVWVWLSDRLTHWGLVLGTFSSILDFYTDLPSMQVQINQYRQVGWKLLASLSDEDLGVSWVNRWSPGGCCDDLLWLLQELITLLLK